MSAWRRFRLSRRDVLRGAGALVAYALLAWKSDVWKDRGAIRHRPGSPEPKGG